MAELGAAAATAEQSGVKPDHIVLDPGLGFSKRTEHSVALIARLGELQALDYPDPARSVAQAIHR